MSDTDYARTRKGSNGNRDNIYPALGDQLDALYRDILAGKVDATGEFCTAIKKTKDSHPKP